MKIIFFVSLFYFNSLFALEKNIPNNLPKSLFRIDNLIPEIRNEKDGKEVYKRAIKVVKDKGIIDADLYEKINLTTAKISAIQSELEDIAYDLRDSERRFNQLKISFFLQFMSSTTHILMEETYHYTLRKINKYTIEDD